MPPMRPDVLNRLFASLTSLPGVGPKLEQLYARLLEREAPRVVDLLFHLPAGVIDRRARPKLNEVQPGQVVDEQGFASLPLVEPVYPLTEGLAPGNVRRAMEGALARLPELPEWQDEAWIARERFPAFAAALRHLHRPAEPHDIAPESLAWTRLAYDELLAGQLALALVRAHMRRQAGRGSASNSS